ncbi:MAG: phospholipid carrier-dependent glycosyltransferase [Leptolyngbya sp. SIO1D8]|nr:phospholipid carrier-dependent glycosyltransferase [Leptolyngbya sp. SIO1D8]
MFSHSLLKRLQELNHIRLENWDFSLGNHSGAERGQDISVLEPENPGHSLYPQGLGKRLFALWMVNLILRLWHLGTPHTLTFDEVYYVPFATDILRNQPFFDAHPPLGKYWIALSMAGFQAGQTVLGLTRQSLPELMMHPLSYRWLNAVIGASIPLLGAWVAWEWSHGHPQRRRQTFVLLSALLLSLDGLLLVESRLALLHIALVGLGLIAVAAWARSHHSQSSFRWRILAGITLGACINVKWNGAGYFLALWCLEGIRRLTPALFARTLASRRTNPGCYEAIWSGTFRI